LMFFLPFPLISASQNELCSVSSCIFIVILFLLHYFFLYLFLEKKKHIILWKLNIFTGLTQSILPCFWVSLSFMLHTSFLEWRKMFLWVTLRWVSRKSSSFQITLLSLAVILVLSLWVQFYYSFGSNSTALQFFFPKISRVAKSQNDGGSF
jgi:hypothetical protein